MERELIEYMDSNFSGDKTDRKSTSDGKKSYIPNI